MQMIILERNFAIKGGGKIIKTQKPESISLKNFTISNTKSLLVHSAKALKIKPIIYVFVPQLLYLLLFVNSF